MMYKQKTVEDCESQVANLLASMTKLPKLDFDAKIGVLLEIVALQEKQIQDLRSELDGHEEDYEHKEKVLTVEEVEAQPC